MPRLLVTGGTGYLGSEIVRLALQQDGYDVVATCHHPRAETSLVPLIPLDLAQPDAIELLIDKVAPTIIIHTAYVQDGPHLQAITAAGAGHVARIAASHGIRLVHMSSDALLDGEKTTPYTEADPPNPLNPYGSAKAEAERLVQAANPDALLVRTSLIYGGTTPSKHETLILHAADGHADVTFFTDEIRSPIQVGDLAAAVLELAPTSASGILNVGGADAVSRYEFACLIATANGRPTTLLKHARSADLGVHRPRFCALDSSLAQSMLSIPLRGVYAVVDQPRQNS